jgi:glycosyltransferase involved in cell wall biosynthesis
MLVSLLTLGCPEQLSGGYLYHCRLAELAGDHDAEVEFVPVRLWPDPFTLAHGDVLLVDSIEAWLVRRTGPPPPRPGHAPPRRPGRRRAGLHRAGPGPPRRPRRPGRAPRRARPDGIARLYAGADVFVLPSWREPYGTVYGEALAAGLPVVGWRAGNLPHLVSDGVEGVVLDPGDIPALAAALDRLASDELWRAAVARAAGRRGAALPRWSHTAATLFAALKELTASAR